MAPAEYPRPDFQRTDLVWESLNGPWDLLFDDNDIGLEQRWQHIGLPHDAAKNKKRTIQVPFVFQCEASGINERGVHEVLWYERMITDIRSAPDQGERLLVRFGAVDYHATVWIDGHFVGEHRGGHVPFDLDLTNAMNFKGVKVETKRLTLRVFDSAFDLTQPRGKQYWGPKPESIFYTPSSGIWQDVWLESVPRLRMASSSHGTIIRSNNIDDGNIDVRIAVLGRRTREPCYIELEASLDGTIVSNSGRKDIFEHEDFVRFTQSVRLTDSQLQHLPSHIPRNTLHKNTALWSPEHPTLYTLRIRLFSSTTSTLLDEITTATGMRSITWTTGDGTLRLNHQPYFHALLLDQGYWPTTLLTPPSGSALKYDIELSKAMGFNGCRKHQKVEDARFLYWADRLGFMVWGEMANAYRFSVDYVERFDNEWMAAVRRDINHPSLVAWTPVNESWGYSDLMGGDVRQREHIRSLYHLTKTLDPTRPINDNCGWEHVVTDLSTFHDYADAAGMSSRCASLSSILERGKNMFLPPIYGADGAQDEGSRHTRGAPVLCTEFGGVNIAAPGGKGDAGRRENWGYTTASDAKDLLNRVEGIVAATVEKGVVCGIVWTQTTDIEQEQNGLYTWDRREKLPAAGVKAVMDRARETYLRRRRR